MAAAFAVAASAPTYAAKSWDRAANIADAAQRLVARHRAEGSRGVVKFLDACYRTHTISSRFTAGLEACLAQDYIHSRVLIEIYARLPDDAKTRFNAPNAGTIAAAMGARFTAVMSQYGLSQSDADALRSNFDKHGLPHFIKSVFPAAADAPDASGSQGGATEGKR